MYLYLLEQERAVDNDTINNHFQTEHIDVSIDEYNKTLSGLFTVVSCEKIISNSIDFKSIFCFFFFFSSSSFIYE